MRLKKQFIITWVLVGVIVTLGPFYDFIEIRFLIISLAILCALSITLQFLLQRKLFDEIHGTKSWERVPLKQFKNELVFSFSIGLCQVLILYSAGYFVIPTSYDF